MTTVTNTVIKGLVALVLLVALAIAVLAYAGKPVPDILEQMGTMGVVAIIGLLTPAPRQQLLEADVPQLEALLAKRAEDQGDGGRHA